MSKKIIFNTTYLEQLNDIVSQNNYFLKSIKKMPKSRDTKGFTYQYYNQFCTCIIRIRETAEYLEGFKFRKVNDCGQAFDFYEFINCISIIEGSVESLFKIFNVEIPSVFKVKNIFEISNGKNTGDLAFFKFIRSASTVHPSETTKYNKQTGHKFEVYPYAIWVGGVIDIFNNRPKNTDIELLSWNCKTNGTYKRYYLSIAEFYKFTNLLLCSLKNLVPTVEDLVSKYKEKLICKRLKDGKDFEKYSDYLLYLRKKLKNKSDDVEFADGGLLLASHIMDNSLISNIFKKYIKSKVKLIRKHMLTDIKAISFNDIFDGLSLYDVIGDLQQGVYAAEKFHDYLYKEAIYEIENSEEKEFKSSIRSEENNLNYSNAEWSVIQLLHFRDVIYINDGFNKANTYLDLFELTLEAIYFYKKKIADNY